MIQAKSFLLTGAILAAGSIFQAETASLRWHPTKGDELSYELGIKGEFDGLPFETTGLLSMSVTEVRGDGGYSVKSVSKGLLVRLGPNETRDDRPNTITAKHDPDGRLISMQGQSDVDSYRVASITKFVSPPRPVSVTDSWRIVREKDRPKGAPGYETRYVFEKVVEVEGKRHAEVSFSMKETSGEKPRTATGKWHIDLANGLPVTLEARVTGMFSGDVPGTITLRRVATR